MANEVRVEESPVGPVVRPPDPTETVILYLPGNEDASKPALETAGHLALNSRATVVVCRYRLAFPAGFVEDVHAAYRYCQSVGPEIVLVGERMGATLAGALLVQLRDWGAALPSCTVLVSGLLDLTLQANSVWLNACADPTLDVADLRRRVAEYAGKTALTDPLLSPLHANLHGLTPVQLLVAGTDLLLDDSLAFAARAARSGVTVDLRVWPEAADLRAETIPAVLDFITRVKSRGIGILFSCK